MSGGLARLLQELVSIPSVSPGECPVDADPTFGEGPLAARVASLMREWGLRPVVEDFMPRRTAVWTRLEAGREKTLLLQAHLDTVAPDPLAPNPFGGEERDGFIHGVGAADCKASLAVFLEAMRVMAGAPERLKYNLVVAGSPDEEHGLTGSRFLAQRLQGTIDFAICGEPTRLVPVTTHKGVLRWRVTVKGRSAHSSTPELGDNAIYRAAPLIAAVERYAASLASSSVCDPALGRPTASLVGARGGSAVNIVPGECELVVDRRLVPGEDEDALEAVFIEALSAAAPPEGWTVERVRSYCRPLERCGPNEFLTGLCEALKSQGLPGETGALHCGADAPNFVAFGCPAIVWGPGDIRVAHSRDERVSVNEVEQAARVLIAFLSR